MSSSNRVRALRKAKNLTQGALAKLAKTSQQQIARIEGGQATRIDVAARISKALGAELGAVFPRAALPLRALKTTGELKDNVRDRLGDAGIDADAVVWRVQFILKSGAKCEFDITGIDRPRIENAIRNGQRTPGIITFRNETHLVGVDPHALVFARFLFDAPSPFEDEEETGPSYNVRLWIDATAEPFDIEVDPDLVKMGTAEEERDDSNAQLQNFIYLAEMGADPDDMLWFEDGDGEMTYLRSGSIQAMEVPLNTINPDLRRALTEEEDT